MTERYRVEVTWPPRHDALGAIETRVGAFLDLLGGVDPHLAGWRWVDPAGAPHPIDGPRSVAAALRACTRVWHAGREARSVMMPAFVLGRDVRAPVAEIDAVLGLDLPDLGPLYAPERVTFLLRADAPEPQASRPLIEGVLGAAVRAFAPDVGHAGTRGFPRPPQALESSGTPAVGWMTWLGRRYVVPRELPEPARVSPVADGALVTATEGLFVGDRADLAAVEAVRVRLAGAGALTPQRRASEGPPPLGPIRGRGA